MLRRMAMGAALVAATSLPLVGGGAAVVAQGNDWTGSLIASDGWRVEVVAAAQGPSIGDAGLDRRDSGEWVLVVADVTNWTGDAAAFPTDDVSVGAGASAGGAVEGTVLTDLNLREGPSIDAVILTGMPAGATVTVTGEAVDGFYPVTFDGLEGYASVDGVSVDGEPAAAGGAIDVDASGDAADELSAADLGDDIDADATVRLTLAFAVGDGAEDVAFQFGSALPLKDALDAGTDLTGLADVVQPTLTDVNVRGVTDEGQILLSDSGVGSLFDATRLTLAGVAFPQQGECFHDEAVSEAVRLTAGDAAFEVVTGDGDDSGYVWVESGGVRVLVNHELIAGGYVDTSFEGVEDRRAEAWFAASRGQAEEDLAGRWGDCSGVVDGAQVPAPSANLDPAGNRAAYEAIDVGDLPGPYLQRNITFSGVVDFITPLRSPIRLGDPTTIPVSAVIQIVATANDGSPVFIIVGTAYSTANLVPGAFVTVLGYGGGTFTGPNGNGQLITVPYVIANVIE